MIAVFCQLAGDRECLLVARSVVSLQRGFGRFGVNNGHEARAPKPSFLTHSVTLGPSIAALRKTHSITASLSASPLRRRIWMG